MKQTAAIIALVLCALFAHSQNVLLNPAFDSLTTCPAGLENQVYSLTKFPGWRQGETADSYALCAPYPVNPQSNMFGANVPGSRFVGLYGWANFGGGFALFLNEYISQPGPFAPGVYRVGFDAYLASNPAGPYSSLWVSLGTDTVKSPPMNAQSWTRWDTVIILAVPVDSIEIRAGFPVVNAGVVASSYYFLDNIELTALSPLEQTGQDPQPTETQPPDRPSAVNAATFKREKLGKGAYFHNTLKKK